MILQKISNEDLASGSAKITIGRQSMHPPKKPRTHKEMPPQTSEIKEAVNELKALNSNLIISSEKECEDE